MDKLIWIILAFIAGAVLPVQGGINVKLGKAAASPVHAAFFSFLVGAVVLLVYLIATKQSFSMAGLKQASPLAWTGGIFGAVYVTVLILAFPQLGPGLTFGLIVAGQMIVSMLLEHFNVLVAQPHPISLGKIAGIVLVVIGVFVMKKY